MALVSGHKSRILLAFFLFIISLLIYGGLAGDWLQKPSIAPHFILLAEAFRHGQVDVTPVGDGYDFIHFDDHWYVAHSPMPALLLLPQVMVQGVANTADSALGVFLGAINVALCYVVLTKVWPCVSVSRRMLLSIFFGFGTAHVLVSPLGTVWFLGHVVATFFVWLFIWTVVTRHYRLAGALLGAILLARPSILPGAILFGWGWWWLDSPQHIRYALRQSIPLFLIAVVGQGAYNAVRFNNPFDFGYSHLQDAISIQERRLEHGQFSLVFLPENLYTATIKPITPRLACLTDANCGFLEPSLQGAGLLWTSPAFLLLFLVRGTTPEESRRLWMIGTASLVAIIPALLYHNTGSAQFGYRFALDGLPFALLLMGAAVRRCPLWLLTSLVVLSCAVSLWGTVWFMHQLGLNG